MLLDPHSVSGLSDAGAHVMMISDCSSSTFHLTHWVRDRTKGERVPLELAVHKLTGAPAGMYGFDDRGVLAPGRKADVNVIDLDNLEIQAPFVRKDLPTGAGRVLQPSTGYLATMVNGTVVRRADEDTGARTRPPPAQRAGGPMTDSLDVVVVGAGIGGLGSALALARAGHRVTVVERDDTPMPADVEAAFEWDRRGAPQVRHPHVFLGLARTILRDRFPDVLAALEAEGVVPGRGRRATAPMQLDAATLAVLRADDDLRMLPCRRTTFEWVVRTRVLAEPGIELRVGVGVSGLLVEQGDVGLPRVTGVALEDGSTLAADVVVATTGRRGDVPAWLEAHGIELPETASDAGVVYFSRFFRARDGATFGFRGAFGAGLGVGVIGSDAGTFSITAVVRPGRQGPARPPERLRSLRRHDAPPPGAGRRHRHRRRSDPPGALHDGADQPDPLVHDRRRHPAGRRAVRGRRRPHLHQPGLRPRPVAGAAAGHDAGRRARRRRGPRRPPGAPTRRPSLERVVPWYHFSVLTDGMRGAGSVSRGRPGGDGFDGALRRVHRRSGAHPHADAGAEPARPADRADRQAARAAGRRGGRPPAGPGPERPRRSSAPRGRTSWRWWRERRGRHHDRAVRHHRRAVHLPGPAGRTGRRPAGDPPARRAADLGVLDRRSSRRSPPPGTTPWPSRSGATPRGPHRRRGRLHDGPARRRRARAWPTPSASTASTWSATTPAPAWPGPSPASTPTGCPRCRSRRCPHPAAFAGAYKASKAEGDDGQHARSGYMRQIN